MSKFKSRRVRRGLASTSWSALAVAACLPFTSAALAQTAPPAADDQADQVDEIVVTGIRASIMSAQDIKRNSDLFADAVTSEDFGKFTDENLAEALQRVPGVQIARDGGEGRRITVRGLGAAFNRVTVNGRTALSSGTEGRVESRSFNFDVIPTEIISSTIVYKSAAADLEEGGIGASVDIRTIRPLEFRAPDGARGAFSVSAKGIYDDFAEAWGHRYGAFANYRLTDDFGVNLSVVSTERVLREDSVVINALDRATVNVAGTPTAGLRPNIVDVNYIDETRTRNSISGAAQWRPTEQLDLTFDALFSSYDTESDRQRGIVFVREATTATSATQGAGGAFTRLAGSNIRVATGAVVFDNLTDLTVLGANAEYTDDNWSFAFDASYSKNEFFQDFRPVAISVNSGAYTFDATGDYPRFTFTNDISNPANYTVGVAASGNNGRNRQIEAESTNEAFAASAERFINRGVFSSGEFGLSYSTLTYDAASYDTGTVNFPAGSAVLLTPPLVDDFFPRGPELGLNRRAGVDFNAAAALYPAILTGRPRQDFLNSYGVEESTLAGFAKLNLSGDRWSGDVGLRVIRTDQSSQGNNVQGNLTPTQVVRPVFESREYTEVLPSANFKYELTENWLLRAAFGQTLTRPELRELAPYTQINDRVNLTATIGNPDLEPFIATSADLAIEYYADNGNSLAAGVFVKDLDSFITALSTNAIPAGETQSFRVTQSVNIDGGRVEGVELAGTYFFDFLPGPFSGLGIQGTYTYVDTDIGITDPASGIFQPLPGISKHNVNIVGSYENGPVALRVAYNRRSEFVNQAAANAALVTFYTLPFEQLDANFTYHVTDRLDFVIDATNLTDETEVQELGSEARYFGSARDAGRRFVVGFGYRF